MSVLGLLKVLRRACLFVRNSKTNARIFIRRFLRIRCIIHYVFTQAKPGRAAIYKKFGCMCDEGICDYHVLELRTRVENNFTCSSVLLIYNIYIFGP